MTKVTASLYSLIATSLLLISSLSNAQEPFYAGIGLGQSASDACDIAYPCDEKSSSWKVLFGYKASDNLGVEINYHDLGTITGHSTIFDAKTELDVTLYSLLLVGSIDIIDDFALFGKIGTAKWSADAKLIQPVAGASYKDDDTSMTYAAGVSWSFAQNQQLSLDWQTYDIEIEINGGLPIISETADTDVISLVYSFSF